MDTPKVKKIKKIAVDTSLSQDISTVRTIYVQGGNIIQTEPKVVKKIKKVVSSENAEIDNVTSFGSDNLPSTQKLVKKIKKVAVSSELIKESELEESDYEGYEGKTLSDDELFSMFESSADKEEMKTESVIEDDSENEVHVDMSKQIKFTRVTDLDPKLYEDFFTKEKFEYGAIFFDWEVLTWDWCVTFYDVMNYKKTVIVNDRKGLMKFYVTFCKKNLLFGFNNRNYDNLIFKAILLGMNPKEVSDKIVSGLKGFQISDKFKEIELNTFDCYKLGLGSLKKCESFLQLSVEETPIPFDIPTLLTKEQMDSILFYNDADVQSTIEVCVKGQYKVYEGNMGLIKMFNFPLSDINKTQAQLTAKITDCEKPKEPRHDEWNLWVMDTVRLNKYKFVADWFMSLRNDHDRPRIETYKNGKFIPYKGKGSKKEGYELHIDVCGIPCVWAMGGAHGAPDKPIQLEKKGKIKHSDIVSMYPSIILQYHLMSRNAKKPEEFQNAYDMRVKYKKEGNPLNKILKIPLNAQYGCTGDVNSPAYDLRNCRMVCITGQLLILSLLETIEPYISLQNLNTDGIIYTVNKEEDEQLVSDMLDEWQSYSKLKFETDTIDSLIQKDVNSYLFNFSNGEVECKGGMLKYNNPLDNDLPILNETMREYMLHKINVADYINNCDEFWKFMKTFKMNGDYKFATLNGQKFDNKCFRVFASKDLKSGALLKWKYSMGTIIEGVNSKGEITKRKYEGEKFAGQADHVFIENKDIRGKKCSEYPMLDKNWYIEEVYNRLNLFGLDARPSMFDEMF